MNLNRITGTRQVPSGIIDHITCKDFVMELKCPSRESNTSSMSNERPHKRYWLIWKSVFQFSFEWTKKFQWYFWNRPTKSHDSFDIYKRRCFFISYSIFFSKLQNFVSKLRRLFLLNQEEFEIMANSGQINRDEYYNIEEVDGLEEIALPNSPTLTVGEKALLYLYPQDYQLYDNFW